MNKIQGILDLMGPHLVIQKQPQLLKSKIKIECSKCSNVAIVSVEAVYRQWIRGHKKYVCKKCSSKMGWTSAKRKQARDRSLEQWRDPNYAGAIVGKAMAHQIIKEIEDD